MSNNRLRGVQRIPGRDRNHRCRPRHGSGAPRRRKNNRCSCVCGRGFQVGSRAAISTHTSDVRGAHGRLDRPTKGISECDDVFFFGNPIAATGATWRRGADRRRRSERLRLTKIRMAAFRCRSNRVRSIRRPDVCYSANSPTHPTTCPLSLPPTIRSRCSHD